MVAASIRAPVITVTGSPRRANDDLAPDISKLTAEGAEANFGEVFNIAYTADGTGSDVTKVELNFQKQFGATIKFVDNDGDGIASALLDHSSNLSGFKISDGEYKFISASITDAGGNTKSNFRPQDFDTKFTVKGVNTVASDTAAPVLKSAALDKTDIDDGTIALLKYVGDGTGSDIIDVSFTFTGRNDPDKTITFTDHDGDGIATAFINDVTYPSDQFLLTGASIIDGGGNINNYDRLTRELDLDLKFTVSVPRASDQTDFEAPELDLSEFLEFNEIV